MMVTSTNGMFDDNVQSVSVKKPKRAIRKKVDAKTAERDRVYATFTKKQKMAFDLAMQFKPIFLTGSGGCGKSYLVSHIVSTLRNLYGKQVIVCAPTGVAANNIGGVTIHRQFGLPLGPCLVGKNDKLRPVEHANAALKYCDVLVCDEASMIRIDQFDSVFYSVRKANKWREERGLAPILWIVMGDYYQIPPVIKDDERKILESYYNNKRRTKSGNLGAGYAFNSVNWDKIGFHNIVLDEVMRQKDKDTIYHLNKIREGKEGFTNYFNHATCMEKIEDGMTLCPYNNSVRRENLRKLAKVEGDEYVFTAELEDNATEEDCDGRYELRLKVGAKVMFLVNDNPGRKDDLIRNRPQAWENKTMFVNGTTGIIRKIHVDEYGWDDYISIEVLPTGDLVELKKNYNDIFIYEAKDGKLIERKLGSWRQYGITLGYACSVHRSQGKSLSHLNVSPNGTFSHGMLYVALSRCTNVENMHLEDFIREDTLIVDEDVLEFYKNLKEYTPE